MAANMIGVKKCIIAVDMGFMNMAMFNPKIVKRSGKYGTEEGCLSLTGVRKCTRYQEIEVEYQDMNFKKQRQKYTGWTAQIIQHEIIDFDKAIENGYSRFKEDIYEIMLEDTEDEE